MFDLLRHQLFGRWLRLNACAYPPTCLKYADFILPDNNIAAEADLAALGSIPWEQIIGWYDQFTMIKGEIRDAVYTKNSQYNKAKYDNQEDAGAQYHLAGFSRNHEAWKKLPWSKFAKCTDKTIIPKPSRRAVNNSARVRTSQSKEPKITTPKTPTSKTPTPKAPTPKISTPQTCTAAQKKAGTCKDETKGTCSPIKTNKEFYNECLRLLKAGKAPKSDAPRIRGSKKKTGKTTPGA